MIIVITMHLTTTEKRTSDFTNWMFSNPTVKPKTENHIDEHVHWRMNKWMNLSMNGHAIARCESCVGFIKSNMKRKIHGMCIAWFSFEAFSIVRICSWRKTHRKRNWMRLRERMKERAVIYSAHQSVWSFGIEATELIQFFWWEESCVAWRHRCVFDDNDSFECI